MQKIIIKAVQKKVYTCMQRINSFKSFKESFFELDNSFSNTLDLLPDIIGSFPRMLGFFKENNWLPATNESELLGIKF